MNEPVSAHYRGGGSLAAKIAIGIRDAGLEPNSFRASDFEPIDEFHFRGREATLQLLKQLNLNQTSKVLDIGSGLGGVSRTMAEEVGVHVTGVDLTQEFCDAAIAISAWVNLGDRTSFLQGDATDMPFPDDHFDGAVTVHVAMNIPDKAAMYSEARRVLKSGARFGIYDILQGEGGEVLYPTPWAANPSISHLATPEEMSAHIMSAGFRILSESDSTSESYHWLKERTTKSPSTSPLPVTTQLLFGTDAAKMAKNQLKGLNERRMLTYSFICEA
ncbi:class I SAM-dependent methyltransferase [Roseovarius aestuarii]|uniref:Demethylrebeccamycin-D-glucose O-methyltransferase n=1 Tax=Roseovarius aestuarii TaxID=475083 RepID=A0A1X7BNS3_9RHOB|nr:class I SAM-dependent methyltransferase [Roseovarius aestuarii]SMC11241.1 Demethylrebeccamycin-D-glucose O-methyltransferase [Roseovarius aestuarii]